MHISMSTIPAKASLAHIRNLNPSLEDRLIKATKSVALREQGYVLKQYQRFVRTWHHYVYFSAKVMYSGADFEVTVTSDDMILYFIDKGTNVRYATMTPDFQPKTAYHQINSKGGAGGLAYINPHIPRPGIRARDITNHIADERAPKFQDNMYRAINRTVVKYWQDIWSGQ
jgi:hypothetical protein